MTEKALSGMNVQSSSIAVYMTDKENNDCSFHINSIESIKALQSFLEFRSIEIRNNEGVTP